MFGELLSERYIRTFPNEETPCRAICMTLALDVRERTLGSKTFQYQEEEKTKSAYCGRHFLSSGERKGKSPNLVLIVRYVERRAARLRLGVVR